jgi:2-polyprenyl-6-methoxyphenol hydroxylase-like FAD-dependent oxidoreductase
MRVVVRRATDMKADVLILGGGPAGGMTALLLARAGQSVVLCEAHEKLPERVCGMYLCPAGVALLDRLGLRERIAGDARRLRGMIMVAPNFERLQTHFPQGDEVPDHGLALRRPQLDETLLALAREPGADVRMGARPACIERAPGGWRAELADGETITAKLLVGADGRKSSTARLLGLTLPMPRSRAALHVNVPARIPAPPFGQMHVFDDGAYVGVDAVASDEVNLSVVCNPAMLRGTTGTDFINEHVARSPHLSALVAPLSAEARPVATFPAGSRVRRAATSDAALVGDAAGHADPLTGEGIYGAMWTAEALADCVTAGWADLPGALARYAQRRASAHRAKAALCELFQFIISRPRLANSVHGLLSRRQAVADSFIGIVGNSYSPARGLARIAQQVLAV